jgi:hypothetical protein
MEHSIFGLARFRGRTDGKDTLSGSYVVTLEGRRRRQMKGIEVEEAITKISEAATHIVFSL